MRLTIPAVRLLRLLLWAVAGMHLLSLIGNVLFYGMGIVAPFPYFDRLVHFFHVNQEKNLPTWFTQALLAAVAYVLWEISAVAKAAGDRFARHWRVLCVVFALLSLDELAQVHNLARRWDVLDPHDPRFLFVAAAAAPLLVFFAVSYLRLLAHLPSRLRTLIIVGAVLFVGGDAALELVNAVAGADVMGMELGSQSMTYVLGSSAEELLETLGTVIFLYAVAVYLQQHLRPAEGTATGGLPPAQATGRDPVTVPAAVIGRSDAATPPPPAVEVETHTHPAQADPA